MSEYRTAKKRVTVSVGESVRSTCYGAHSTSPLAAMHHKPLAGVSTNHFQNKGLVLDHALF